MKKFLCLLWLCGCNPDPMQTCLRYHRLLKVALVEDVDLMIELDAKNGYSYPPEQLQGVRRNLGKLAEFYGTANGQQTILETCQKNLHGFESTSPLQRELMQCLGRGATLREALSCQEEVKTRHIGGAD